MMEVHVCKVFSIEDMYMYMQTIAFAKLLDQAFLNSFLSCELFTSHPYIHCHGCSKRSGRSGFGPTTFLSKRKNNGDIHG